MEIKIVAVCAVIGLLVLLNGCVEDQEDTGNGKIESKISFTEIRVGDMPTEDFSHVNVTFSEIKLHSNESGWVSIPLETTTVDLIYLHMNNLTEQLGIGEIEVGNYTKLWIVVDNASGVLTETDDTVYFDVPSDTLKIQHLFKFEEGNNTITVDIDLDNSIHTYGNGELYKLLPVISELNISHSNRTTIRFRNQEKIINYGNGTQIKLQDNNTLKNMVGNRKPAIDIVVNGSRGNHVTINTNESITFNASSTYDVDNDTITYAWDFDDGTTSTEVVVTHIYSEKGTYHITLTASDGELEDTATITVTVKQSSGQGNGPN